MKTKLILFLAAIALVTLSFTFASVQGPVHEDAKPTVKMSDSEPIGGLFADQVVE